MLVSGAPGSGKTTLAVPLAAELGFTLLRKDRIKETLHDVLGAPAPDLAWSRRLGAAAMEAPSRGEVDRSSVVGIHQRQVPEFGALIEIGDARHGRLQD